MKIRPVAAVLLCSLAIASCAGRSELPSKGFEGTITEVIQIPGIADMMNHTSSDASDSEGQSPSGLSMLGAASNVTLKMYVRENKVAYDISLLGGLINMRSIIDRNARTLTVLLPTHSAMVMDLRMIDSARGRIDDSLRSHMSIFDSLQALVPQPTGAKKTMHGLEAEEYRAAKDGTEVDLWLSSNEKIKAFEIIRDAFLGRGSMGEGGLDQIFGMMRPVAGKIPVKFETKLHGKTFAKGELTDISEEKVDDAVFEVPKDYEIVNADSVKNSGAKPGPLPRGTTKERHFTSP
jgi:hypothetical protein